MGKSSPTPPAAPDPATTAAAQTKSNQQTALYDFGLSNPNYNTPLGNLNYNITNSSPTYDQQAYDSAMKAWQSGNKGAGSSGPNNPDGSPMTGGALFSYLNSHTDANGNPYDMTKFQNGTYNGQIAGSSTAMPQLSDFKLSDAGNPQATANVSLSPGQQQLYDQNTAQSIGLSTLAGQLQNRVGSTLNQPLPTSGDLASTAQNAQDAYYKQQTQYLDPQFAQAQQQLNAKDANQGITQGSEAYNTDQLNFSNQKQQAYSNAQQNAILQGTQNAQQLFALNSAQRSQPLNEFNALRSQSQVQMPSFSPTQPTNVAPTNVAGITQQAYQNSLNPYNAQIAANNQTTGGLFGLAGSGLGAFGSYAGSAGGSAALASLFAASDIRLKENIHYIGHEKGHAIYSFNYIRDPEKIPYRGVMAQEVLNYAPDAVVKDGEYYMVNYAKLGLEFGRLH